MKKKTWTRRLFLSGATSAACVGCSDPTATTPSGSTGGDPLPEGSTSGLGDGSTAFGLDDSTSTGAASSSSGESTSTGLIETTSGGDDRSDALNIVFITADDLGWKALDIHGPLNHRPRLDAFAAASRSFPRAFNVTSSCSSSRASFATGLYPSQHGVTGLVHRFPDLSLAPDAFTIARALSEHGYVTGINGKFHISHVDPPEAFGYSEVGPGRIDDADFIRDFLESHVNEPFFLELNFRQTHRRGNPRRWPIDPLYPVSPAAVQVPEYWALPDSEGLRACMAGYLSQFCVMDALIGETIAIIDQLGIRDRTMILFVSDNGIALPNNKTTLYDRGTGSPCLYSDPRDGFVGVDQSLVSSIDYATTILDAAGIKVEGLPGGRLSAIPEREGVYSEMFWHAAEVGMRAIRNDDWKFIINTNTDPIGPGDTNEDWERELDYRPWMYPRDTFELYDLAADPQEQNNLYKDEPEVVAELYDLLLAHAEETGDPTVYPALES